MTETPAEPPKGSVRFGDFEVKGRIGMGGMGEVFRARRHGSTSADVALKLIRPDHAANPRFRQMFEAEARISGLLHHANIVRLLGFGDVDGILYLAMELVEGVSLERIVQAEPLPTPIAAYVACELLRALDYAHRLLDDEGKPFGLIHRDVSAVNVLLSVEGHVKLSDFGVAKLPRLELTLTDEVKGKRSSMAPEQAQCDPFIDSRADVFSAGILLHRLLYGKAPFEDVLLWLQQGAQPPRHDGTIGAIVTRALARHPEDRYASCSEFADEIARAIEIPADASEDLAALVTKARRAEPGLAKLDQLILADFATSSSGATGTDTRHTPVAASTKVERPRPVSSRPAEPERAPRRGAWIAGGSVTLVALAALAFWPRAVAPVRTSEVQVAPQPVPAVAPQVVPTPIVTATTPRAHARAKPSAPSEEKGTLTLDTTPWATVYLGARKIGTTPFAQVALAAGTHHLSLDVQNSGRRRPLTVTIRPGRETRLSAPLR